MKSEILVSFSFSYLCSDCIISIIWLIISLRKLLVQIQSRTWFRCVMEGLEETGNQLFLHLFSYRTWTKLKQNSHFGPIVDFETDSLPFNKDLMNFSPSLVIQCIQRLSTCRESYHTTLKEKLHFFSSHLFIFVSTHVHTHTKLKSIN